jgi:membrane protein DedA with SNARE-associated domain
VPDFELIRDLLIGFGACVGAGFGLPIPEELAIIAAGIWTAAKAVDYPLYRWLMLPVCIVGVIIADVVLYCVGRFFGTRLLDRSWFARMVPRQKREKIERNFDHYGLNILLFGRLLPGIRSPLFITAGTMRLPVSRFVLADGLGAVLGNSILFFLAFWFGDQFRELVEGVEHRAKPLIILIVIVAIAALLLVHFLRRPVPTGDLEELPIIGKTVASHIDSATSHKHPVAHSEGMQGASPAGKASESREESTLRPGRSE